MFVGGEGLQETSCLPLFLGLLVLFICSGRGTQKGKLMATLPRAGKCCGKGDGIGYSFYVGTKNYPQASGPFGHISHGPTETLQGDFTCCCSW